jgi:hypothetical protein
MKQDNNIKSNRPESYNNQIEEYLDNLRKIGNINMFGASLFLEQNFGMPKAKALACLAFWMQSF